MTRVLITICYLLSGEEVCDEVARFAAVELEACRQIEEGIELMAVQSILTHGFPHPVASVTAVCKDDGWG